MYGSVTSHDTLMTKLFSESQKNTETCAQWASRLEEVGYAIAKRDIVMGGCIDQLLASRFWAGLNDPDIKKALWNTREKRSLDELVADARSLEEEFAANKRRTQTYNQKQRPKDD